MTCRRRYKPRAQILLPPRAHQLRDNLALLLLLLECSRCCGQIMMSRSRSTAVSFSSLSEVQTSSSSSIVMQFLVIFKCSSINCRLYGSWSWHWYRTLFTPPIILLCYSGTNWNWNLVRKDAKDNLFISFDTLSVWLCQRLSLMKTIIISFYF